MTTSAEALEEAKRRYQPLMDIFRSETGQKAMAILEEEFIFQPSYVTGDSHSSAHREGQRHLALWIRDIVINQGE